MPTKLQGFNGFDVILKAVIILLTSMQFQTQLSFNYNFDDLCLNYPVQSFIIIIKLLYNQTL